jgi:hypothetical protein
MARQPVITLLSTLFIAGLAPARAEEGKADVVVKPMSTQTNIDVGQIVHGWNEDLRQDFEGQFLSRTSVWLMQEGTINKRLDIKMGVGGVFWYVLPEQDGAPHTRLVKFGPGIRQAQLTYHIGDIDRPWLDIQAGYFPFKYNPEASNLGEYLLRSGTYPGFLITGGWNIVNSAVYMAQGLNVAANLWDGRFKANLLMPMERDNPPMHSISPTLIASVKPMDLIELGAGVTYNHGISVKPSKETPKGSAAGIGPTTAIIKEVRGDSVIRDTTQFYTFQGVKVMGRATLDPKALMPGVDIFSPPDLKLFAEFAILGVKDYPFYYDNIKNRIPIMFGMNLPTFKILDLLSVQGEFYDHKFKNNIEAVYEYQWPIWYVKDYDPVNINDSATAKEVKRDRWNWSVLARKDVTQGVKIWLQVANDHLRTYDYNVKPVKVPVTVRPTDWYYLFRLEFGF